MDKIEIRNVKGIEHAIFDVSLIPNKPSLIVAPNGFGKSSIAAAFASLNSKRIEVHKDSAHKGDESLKPVLKIAYINLDGTKVEEEATDQKNELHETFDIYVINSQLISKAKKIKISGNTIVSSAIEVAPIVLSKIPPATKLAYSYAESKAAFGKNGKILPNITAMINDHCLIEKIWDQVDFSKLGQVKLTTVKNNFKDLINASSGNTANLVAGISPQAFQTFSEIPYINKLTTTLKNSTHRLSSEIEYLLAALQFTEIYASDKAQFKAAAARASYMIEKEAYVQTFSSLKGTWKKITPKEIDGQLVVTFPKANQISNGERDIICFVAHLKKAKLKFKKNKCILIIDEIFDYLDDANLVACQFYLTKMISDLKLENRQIFPLIMTHLSPSVFRNFTFSDQKVCYLSKSTPTNRSVEKLIIKRFENSIKDQLSKYFLHFHCNDEDLTNEFQTLGMPVGLASSSQFADHCANQLDRYLQGQSFDPLAVCCSVRRRVEALAYEQLNPDHCEEFLLIHKTASKLDFAKSNGAIIPEVFFLLGVIYNEAMHLRDNEDNFSALGSKLSNLTIKHMIATLPGAAGR
ncbi:hypothetical protein [Pseudomonas viridiflava]|uniref:hypothetical protein n=1 Tax=Pseudomonas viridiflava TaxID=33069 RepID=UPI001F11F3EB|nr:hypothetical protein [Pseudomonas viridiflava]